jgi:hypothetical protein
MDKFNIFEKKSFSYIIVYIKFVALNANAKAMKNIIKLIKTININVKIFCFFFSSLIDLVK